MGSLMATGQGSTDDQRTVTRRLFDAARDGQVKTVRKLLRKHPSEVDNVGDDGDTALMRASYYEHTDVVQLLLEAGASINKKNDREQSALHRALDCPWTRKDQNDPKVKQIVKKLLQAGHDINSVDIYGNTPLFNAIRRRHTKVMKLLINHPEIDLSIKNKQGQNLLHCVSEQPWQDHIKAKQTLEMLLQRGLDINSVDGYGYTPLFYAIRFGSTEVIKLLINHPEIDLSIKNKQGQNLLHCASECGKVDLVKTLLQRRAEINSVVGDGNTPLVYAIRDGNIEVVELLINQPDIDLSIKNKQGQNLLHCACERSWTRKDEPKVKSIVEKLLQAGLDVNSVEKQGNTPLFYAIRQRNTEIIELLINHPEIDLSIKNKQGQNLLHCACERSWTRKDKSKVKPIVEKLLQAGLDANSLDGDGNTPLFHAVSDGNTKVVELLINHPDIDLSIKNKQGQNLVHCAIEFRWRDHIKAKQNVKMLLQRGLDINSVDGDGNTPLFYAIKKENTEVVKLLINLPEIDLSLKNKRGQNALHCASKRSWKRKNDPKVKKIVKKMLQAGIDVNSVDGDCNTPLFYAIENENTEVVKLLINHPEIDLSLKNKRGQNALHCASKRPWQGHVNAKQIVEMLLQRGLVNSVDGDGNTPLFYAIRDGNTEVVELLINYPEIDLSIKNNDGQNLLHRACESGKLDVVKTLLQRGAEINSVVGDGNTPLVYAISNGNIEVVELLINHPEIDLSIKNKQGQNVLHRAIQGSGTHKNEPKVKPIVEKLLQAGLDVNLMDKHGNTPLFYAISKRYTKVIELLNNHPEIDLSIKNKQGQNLLHCACDRSWTSKDKSKVKPIVEKLLQAGLDVNSLDGDGYTPLSYALRDGNTDVIELLINHPEIDLSIQNLLHCACQSSGTRKDNPKIKQIVEKLLQAGLDVNSVDRYGNTPLFLAIRSGNTNVIELLINHPEIDLSIKNNEGQNLLHFASKYWEVDVVKTLLQRGVEINSVDKSGNTPLFNAIWEWNTEVIELLIKHPDIDLSLKKNQGQNVLHYASIYSFHSERSDDDRRIKPTVEKLIQAGLDVNSVDENGDTPLFYAIRRENREVIELLINHPEIDLSIKNNDGVNLLHCASKCGNVDVAETLLQRGAEINSVTTDGNTALVFAIWVGNTEVIELLINHPEIDLSLKNKQCQNLLHCACQCGKMDVVKTLLQRGAEINSVDGDGNTPLFYAISRGNTEVVELLINHPEIDLSIKNKKSQNLLHCASKRGNRDVVETLLQRGAEINSVDGDGDTPLFYAIRSWNTDVVELLINHPEIDLSIKNNGGQNLLHCASQCPYVRTKDDPKVKQIVEKLLQAGLDVNSMDNDGNTSLHLAVKEGNKKAIKLLINHPKIDFSIKNKEGSNAFHFAVLRTKKIYQKEVLQMIFKKVDINSKDKDGDTPIHIAVNKEETEVTELLIDQPNIDLSLCNDKGFTVLSLAVLRNDLITTKLLIDKHPSIINTKDGNGLTALHLAAHNGHDQIVSFLIENGADVEVTNYELQTPLQMAVKQCNLSTIELLVTNGAGLNAIDGDGNTCLHLAITKYSDSTQEDSESSLTLTALKIVCFLVKKGADLTIKNSQGMTAFDLIQDPEKRTNFKKLVETCI